VYEAIRGKVKRATICQSSSEKRCGTINSFCFDVLTQLSNISARITLYELLSLSKSTIDALREALAEKEIFVTQILATCQEEDDNHCHHP